MHRPLHLLPKSAIFVAFFGLCQVQGAATIYEPFDYNTGDLNGNGSASLGFTGNWGSDNRYDVDAGSSSFGSLVSAGNRMGINNTGSGMHRVSAGIDTSAIPTADGGTLWFSFLITTYQISGDDSFIVALATDPWNPGETAQPGQAVGFQMNNGGGAQARFWNSNSYAGTSSGSTDLIPNTWTGGESQTQFIVGRIDWGADALSNDTLRLFNVDTGLAEPLLGDAFSTASFASAQGDFDRLALTGRNGLVVDLDEIRFGASFSDVAPVPEPSAAWLGMLGVVLLLRRRK